MRSERRRKKKKERRKCEMQKIKKEDKDKTDDRDKMDAGIRKGRKGKMENIVLEVEDERHPGENQNHGC